MKLLILLSIFKLLTWINIFKHIEKHEQLVLDMVKSFEQDRRKCFEISPDIMFIRPKLVIKARNNKIHQKIARIIMNIELQPQHHWQHKLWRKTIKLMIKLKNAVGHVLSNVVTYILDTSIRQRSIVVTKRYEETLTGPKKDKRTIFGEDANFVCHTIHNIFLFISYHHCHLY